MKTVADILSAYTKGVLSIEDVCSRLDEMEIRGGLNNIGTPHARYTGYDYRRQIWINVSLAAFATD